MGSGVRLLVRSGVAAPVPDGSRGRVASSEQRAAAAGPVSEQDQKQQSTISKINSNAQRAVKKQQVLAAEPQQQQPTPTPTPANTGTTRCWLLVGPAGPCCGYCSHSAM
jgi:hypothetical protein